MKANPVAWFEIYVADMARAKKFYTEVFKTELSTLSSGSEMEMWAFPMDNTTVGVSGTLVKMNGIKPGGNSVMVYFESDGQTGVFINFQLRGGNFGRN